MSFQKKFVIILVLALGAGATYWRLHSPRPEAGIEYQMQAIDRGAIETVVNTAGTISPVVTVDVGSELSGLVTELLVDFNAEVSKGQVIARIDDRTIRAQLRQAEADLAASQANLKQQQANLLRAKADRNLAQAEFERLKPLKDKDLASQSDLDQAEASFEGSAANIALAEAQIAAAKADLLQREAALDQAQLNLDRTYIRSPVEGTVVNRAVDIGQTVAASFEAPVLFTIAQDLSKMQIEADVDEADIGRIREGMSARFSVDAFPERQFRGQVGQVRKAATVTNNVVTYTVIISASNPQQLLLPGMTANIDIILGQKDDILRLPNSALRFRPPASAMANSDNPGGGMGPDMGRPGGSGGNPMQAMNQVLAAMALTAEQQQQVKALQTEMQEKARALFANSGGMPSFRGGPREQFMQLRQSFNNKMRNVLNAEQYQAFLASQGDGPGATGVGSETRRGEIYVLVDGKPQRQPVRIGLSDDEFTEVMSNNLKEGDKIIVRAVKSS